MLLQATSQPTATHALVGLVAARALPAGPPRDAN